MKLAQVKLRETAIEQTAVMDISAPLDRAYAEQRLCPGSDHAERSRNLIRYKAGRVFLRDWIEASGAQVAGMRLVYVDGGGDREAAQERKAKAIKRRANLGDIPGMTPLRLAWVMSFVVAEWTPHGLAKRQGCDVRTVWNNIRAGLDALAEHYGARLDTVHTWRVEKVL